MINPFSIAYDPVEFELKGLRIEPSTFWSYGCLEFLGSNGKTRTISLGEVSEPLIKWEVDTRSPAVKALITGSAIICGEHENEISRVHSVTISGPQTKLRLLQNFLLQVQGFALVA